MIPLMLTAGPSSRGGCTAVRGSLRGTGARGDACACTLLVPSTTTAVSQRCPQEVLQR